MDHWSTHFQHHNRPRVKKYLDNLWNLDIILGTSSLIKLSIIILGDEICIDIFVLSYGRWTSNRINQKSLGETPDIVNAALSDFSFGLNLSANRAVKGRCCNACRRIVVAHPAHTVIVIPDHKGHESHGNLVTVYPKPMSIKSMSTDHNIIVVGTPLEDNYTFHA